MECQILENNYYIHNDLVILGCTLWTDYRLLDPIIPQELAMLEAQKTINDFKYIRNSSEKYRKLRPKDCLDSHNNSLMFLKHSLDKFKSHKVGIVTHHPPIVKCINPRYSNTSINSSYASNLDKFVAESNALFWVSGHTHYSVDYMLGNTRIISNPKGYSTDLNPDFVDDLVIEV